MRRRQEKKAGMSKEAARHVANVLICPHQWSTPKVMRVVMGKQKPRDLEVRICNLCGTNRVDHDGIQSLYPPQKGQKEAASA
jgi:ribosomal protein L24